MDKRQNNAYIEAKIEGGYVSLYLYVNEIDKVSIKVNDYGGTKKHRAKSLAYKIYKEVSGNDKSDK